MTFEDYWGRYPEPDKVAAEHAWNAGQAAERERIKEIINQVGVQANHNEWFDCCVTILKRIEE